MTEPKRRGRPPAPRTPAAGGDAEAVTVRVVATSYWTNIRHETGDVLEIDADAAALAIERGLVEAA